MEPKHMTQLAIDKTCHIYKYMYYDLFTILSIKFDIPEVALVDTDRSFP